MDVCLYVSARGLSSERHVLLYPYVGSQSVRAFPAPSFSPVPFWPNLLFRLQLDLRLNL